MIYSIGDEIITKKAHACGGNEWIIIRTGADIKIKCKKCGRIIMIESINFDKIIKKHMPKI
jgi:hypothetical protein